MYMEEKNIKYMSKEIKFINLYGKYEKCCMLRTCYQIATFYIQFFKQIRIKIKENKKETKIIIFKKTFYW